MQHHTSTHIMNWALREVLGDHVQQKGSLVDPEKTRFDFSHHAAVTDDELARVESLVKQRIADDLAVFAEEVPQKEALKINGLRAVFGEKYPEIVRVVSIGVPVAELLRDPGNARWRQYSVEFCGGTHLKRTAEAQAFVLIEESAVARGVRRVVGISGQAARDALRRGNELEAALADASLTAPDEAARLVEKLYEQFSPQPLPLRPRALLNERYAQAQKTLKQADKEQARRDTADVLARAEALLVAAPRVGGTAVVAGVIEGGNAELFRSAADSVRAQAGSAAVLFAAELERKAVLLAAMTPDVVKKGVRAGDLIKEIAPIVGGKGGGRPDLAQGGGPEAGRIEEAVAAARTWLERRLG